MDLSNKKVEGDPVYILKTGSDEVLRLQYVNELYGPGSREVLLRAGLSPGMRVVELGCGSGNMTAWIAEQVGPTGSVVGVDASAAQIEQAERLMRQLGYEHVSFRVADIHESGLEPESFDLAYCRLVLIHSSAPERGLAAMRELVRPGGTVLCEEFDIDHWLCDPPSAAMDRIVELHHQISDRWGINYTLGSRLYRLFRQTGFGEPAVRGWQPFVANGECKRLWGISFRDMGPHLVERRLASKDEVQTLAAEAIRLADDPATLMGYFLMLQVWATK